MEQSIKNWQSWIRPHENCIIQKSQESFECTKFSAFSWKENIFFFFRTSFWHFHLFLLQLSKVCQALHPCIMKVSTNISFVNDGYFNIWQWIYVTWLMVLRSTCWYVCLGPGTAHTGSTLMFISNSVSTQHHTLGLTNCLN